MAENTLGTYDCHDCGTTFKITGTSVTSGYEDWVPHCPICGYDDEVQQTDKPKHTA